MWCVSRKLHESPGSKGFRIVTLLNLWEQLIYNVLLGAVGVLYYWGFFWGTSFMDHGDVQAAYYGAYFALYWLMHAQILLFFSSVKPDDPFYSSSELGGISGSCVVIGRPCRRGLSDQPVLVLGRELQRSQQADVFASVTPDVAEGLPTAIQCERRKEAEGKSIAPSALSVVVLGTQVHGSELELTREH